MHLLGLFDGIADQYNTINNVIANFLLNVFYEFLMILNFFKVAFWLIVIVIASCLIYGLFYNYSKQSLFCQNNGV
jgi:hypothetical protein